MVNQALAEHLERRLRPDRERGGSSASYSEMSAREDRHDVFWEEPVGAPLGIVFRGVRRRRGPDAAPGSQPGERAP